MVPNVHDLQEVRINQQLRQLLGLYYRDKAREAEQRLAQASVDKARLDARKEEKRRRKRGRSIEEQPRSDDLMIEDGEQSRQEQGLGESLLIK